MATRRVPPRRIGAALLTTGALIALAATPASAFTGGASSADTIRSVLLEAEQVGADAGERDQLDSLEQPDASQQGDTAQDVSPADSGGSTDGTDASPGGHHHHSSAGSGGTDQSGSDQGGNDQAGTGDGGDQGSVDDGADGSGGTGGDSGSHDGGDTGSGGGD